MSSNMIALCAEKCFEFKKIKKSLKKQTPNFSKTLKDAYTNHKEICAKWRDAGRPEAAGHPAKAAKLESQRNIQKISRNEESTKARVQHDDLMDTHDNNISDVCKKLKKIRGEKTKSTNIEEIETFLGKYRGPNVLEGFRANTEFLCNDKTKETFSEEFLDQCSEDMMIIRDISEYESLKIPPISLQNFKDIIFKRLKTNKACDIYMLTTEHLRCAGDKVLTQLCCFINRVLQNLQFFAAAEFKMAVASVIYKAKDKPKQHHKSYRLVRICPLIGRIIDEHIRPMAVQRSKPLQSGNQYGFTENISYLMGALQRHEAQKFCIDTKKTFFRMLFRWRFGLRGRF